jgi:transcription antitermination factor NusA-like protein
VLVPERMLSLAIGKEGQNARLAAKLTGWRIDIKSALSAEDGEEMDDDEVARRAAAMLRAEAAGNGHVSENGYEASSDVEALQESVEEEVEVEA